MEFANHLIVFVGALFLLSILAGVVSSRIGAPLLLVFLGLGMLLGEEGPVGVSFGDFEATFVVASISLAIILFDGGLRTPLSSVRTGWAPALSLATVGVVITAVVVSMFAVLVFDGGWMQALLIGAIIGSTDAAAVFLLLHQRGMTLRRRLGATLEIESGANDPMAIFLTIITVELVVAGDGLLSLAVVEVFVRQMVLGALFGILGGKLLGWAVNRLELASGLYPVFVVSGALFTFGLTQELGGSGFLAVYLAGIVAGNERLRASKLIRRFHDGIAWLSQIIMFVMLGLLVTPSNLLDGFFPSILVALVLIFIARPLAVFICLLPFRFKRAERVFIAWVGLRGAVPIYLAMIPVLGGLSNSMHYFNVAFLVVLT
ncbi:MAG: potassium/proton antiporter, partial [Sphingomonadales bacterium]